MKATLLFTRIPKSELLACEANSTRRTARRSNTFLARPTIHWVASKLTKCSSYAVAGKHLGLTVLGMDAQSEIIVRDLREARLEVPGTDEPPTTLRVALTWWLSEIRYTLLQRHPDHLQGVRM